MSTPTEYFRWWIVDEVTGKRWLTWYAMTRAQAAERFPDAEPDLRTRGVRELRAPAPGELYGNTRPAGRDVALIRQALITSGVAMSFGSIA